MKKSSKFGKGFIWAKHVAYLWFAFAAFKALFGLGLENPLRQIVEAGILAVAGPLLTAPLAFALGWAFDRNLEARSPDAVQLKQMRAYGSYRPQSYKHKNAKSVKASILSFLSNILAGSRDEKKKKIIMATAGIILLMTLFPPFYRTYKSGTIYDYGYHFFLFPPSSQAVVNIEKLFLQWIAIITIGVLGFYSLAGSKYNAQKDLDSEQNLDPSTANEVFDQNDLDGAHALRIVLSEIKVRRIDRALWEKVLFDAGGEIEKAKSLYIEERKTQIQEKLLQTSRHLL